MAVATAKGLFNEHFVSPATATWNALQNGAQSSITRADISGNLWNSLVCSAPYIAGGGAAYAINQYAHKHWVAKLPFKSLSSLIVTTISCIAGATASFVAVRVLSANSITLSSFTADKVLCLTTLYFVAQNAVIPISTFFGLPLRLFFEMSTTLGATAAISGYFGERSLYVIGAFSALTFAVNASFPGEDGKNKQLTDQARTKRV